MIGVFDSGAGGVSAVLALGALLPETDMVFLADRKNSPYGVKSHANLLKILKKNIRRLTDMGAEKILIACCTASALYPFLSEREKNITLPIIALTAESIPESHKRVAVIATEYTVKSHAFSEAIKGICPTTEVAEMPMQSLVRKVEISRECGIPLEELAAPELASIDELIKSHRADSLILGCTHFSWLEKILMERYEALKILNPAVLGAKRLAAQISLSSKKREQGRIIYTE